MPLGVGHGSVQSPGTPWTRALAGAAGILRRLRSAGTARAVPRRHARAVWPDRNEWPARTGNSRGGAQGDGWPRLRCRMFVERELLNERGYIVLRCARALEPGEGGQYVEMDKGVGPAAMAVGTSRSRHRLTRQRKR